MDRERLKEIFLGSKLRIAGTVLLSLVALVVLAVFLGILGVPGVESVENRFGTVNQSATEIETNLTVANPNPFGISLGDSRLEYAVRMNDIRMAAGTYHDLGIGAGNTTLPFTSYLDNEKIPSWWVSHVERGEQTDVAVDATVHSSLLPMSVAAPQIERNVTTDITAAFNSTETQPVNANQAVISDPVVYVNETSGHWAGVTDAETRVDMTFRLYNPKSYPIGASQIEYDIGMNGIAVGEGATTSEVVIPPGASREVTATTVIRNDRLDEWWVSHLQANQQTTLVIDFRAKLDLSGGGLDPITIPLDTMESSFETDIFGTKGESTDSQDGESTPTDTAGQDTPTPTETSGQDTPTPTDDGLLGGSDTPTPSPTDSPTDTPTPTATPTETQTDDGGLLG